MAGRWLWCFERSGACSQQTEQKATGKVDLPHVFFLAQGKTPPIGVTTMGVKRIRHDDAFGVTTLLCRMSQPLDEICPALDCCSCFLVSGGHRHHRVTLMCFSHQTRPVLMVITPLSERTFVQGRGGESGPHSLQPGVGVLTPQNQIFFLPLRFASERLRFFPNIFLSIYWETST